MLLLIRGGAGSLVSRSLACRGLLWTLAVLCSGPPSARAAFEIAGGGARSTALAGAFTAVGDDPESVWFNPAGSARVSGMGFASTHALLYPQLDDGPSLTVLSAHFPLRGGSLQTGISLLGNDEWSEQVFIAGYGRSLHPRIALGGQVASLGWQSGDLSRRTLRIDLGTAYEWGWISHQAYVRLALTLGNLNRANIAASGHGAGRSPLKGVIAASVDMQHQRLLVDLLRQGGDSELRLGYETRPEGWAGIEFRTGGSLLVSHWDHGELDAGLGHAWRDWHFDYAYSYPLTLGGFGGTHRLGVRWLQ